MIRQSANPASGTHLMVGDEITYTITVTAKGEADQEDVVVWDVVPGFDSDLPDSLSTTYVAESADCDVECWITEVDEELLIWELGDLAAGESASVWFTVEIDKVNMPGTGTVRVGNVSNVAWAESVTDGPVLSNTVNHPVSAVLSGKITNPPAKPTKPVLGAPVRPVEHVKEVGTKVVGAKVLAKALPRTGVDAGLPLGLGGVLLLLGGALVAGTRQRKQPAHRK